MSSHLVDALENFATLGTRRGVGEVLVLHVVGELGKHLVTVGTCAWSISEQTCKMGEIQLQQPSMSRKTGQRFVVIFVASQLILGREHFSTEVTRKVFRFRMNVFNVAPQIILLNIFVAIRTFSHPCCCLVS